MGEMEAYLATVPIFRGLNAEQIGEIAPHCRNERFEAGATILHQGEYSEALYFLRSGQLAVRVRRGERRETVVNLLPPAVFGELSFITGRAGVADIDVVVDAEVIVLPKSAMAQIKTNREPIMLGMMNVLAERLQDATQRGQAAPEWPVVALRNLPNWEAPLSFAAELGKSLARTAEAETLVVNLSDGPDSGIRPLSDRAFTCAVNVAAADDGFRADMAQRLTDWRKRFSNVVLNPMGPMAAAIMERIQKFAGFTGTLAGRGDDPGVAPGGLAGAGKFILQEAAQPRKMTLCGNQQLIWEAAEEEQAYLAGKPPTRKFLRTVDSIARSILNLQVGIALGGGAAWGFAHIGILEQLDKAGLPIDVVSGCSMGSVVGALYCCGMLIPQLLEAAGYWGARTRGFVEWRLWRMSLISEKAAHKVFAMYFSDRCLSQMEIPYWANAVDIKTGREFTISDGTIVDCLRASIALPGLLPPFQRGDRLLVDAAIMDPVPADLVRSMGARYVVAVNAMAGLEEQPISKRFPMVDIMLRCTRILGHEIGQARAEEAANVVLTPRLDGISMLDFGNSGEIIERGRRAAIANMPAIMAGYERIKPRHAAALTN